MIFYASMDEVMNGIYPSELSLTSDNAIMKSNYLDLSLEIRNNKIHTSLFDKRDAFNFTIVNFPNLSGNIPKKETKLWCFYVTINSLCTLLPRLQRFP